MEAWHKASVCVCVCPCSTAATTKYTGPAPTVTHVHGMEGVQDNSDGYAEAWFLPNATNLAGYTPVSRATFRYCCSADSCSVAASMRYY